MNKIYIFVLSFPLFFLGCGGSSSDSKINNEITSYLIDTYISGVSYKCDKKIGLTSIDGSFSCPKGSMANFSIGDIVLGNILIESADANITPAKLFGLENSNIEDIRILNFIQLIQSLDDDLNSSNGLNINSATRDNLIGYSLDLTNQNITQNDINSTLNYIGKSLISKEQALEHYIYTLTNILKVSVQDEPYFYQQWYLDYNKTIFDQSSIDENAHINFNKLYETYTGKGIKIAVIDDGIDINHEDLEGAIVDSYDLTTKTTNVSHTFKKGYHGTAVTGIIGARRNNIGIQGIASGSDIIFLKHTENMSDSQTIELFNKAQELGADIINCSWGTYDVSLAVKEKIQDLAINGRDGKGIIIIFATGNDDQDMGNDESSIPEVISVSSTNKNNLRAWYSNYGENLDIVAPGGYDIGLTTLDNMEDNGIAVTDKNYLLYDDYNTFIGTSASAPIVSGAIALVLEKNPNLTRVEIETILQNSSDKIGNLPYVNSRNDYYGYGKINLFQLLNSI